MENDFLRPVSVGKILRLIVEANPDLQAQDVLEVIRMSSTKNADGHSTIDEAKALRLAAQMKPSSHF